MVVEDAVVAEVDVVTAPLAAAIFAIAEGGVVSPAVAVDLVPAGHQEEGKKEGSLLLARRAEKEEGSLLLARRAVSLEVRSLRRVEVEERTTQRRLALQLMVHGKHARKYLV